MSAHGLAREVHARIHCEIALPHGRCGRGLARSVIASRKPDVAGNSRQRSRLAGGCDVLSQQGRPPESARGLAQSKTLRTVRKSQANALRLGLIRSSAAFSCDISNCANINRNRHTWVQSGEKCDEDVIAPSGDKASPPLEPATSEFWMKQRRCQPERSSGRSLIGGARHLCRFVVQNSSRTDAD
jgi:hypothetical protein